MGAFSASDVVELRRRRGVFEAMRDEIMNRRRLLVGLGGIAVVGAGWTLGGQSLFYRALTPELAGETIAADVAHDLVQAGNLILIDIRRPDEWAATGSPVGAVQVDMRSADFADQMRRIREAAPGTPLAVICMRGVRSARVTNDLIAAGFTDIRDVSEGMLGSAAGPGWIGRGLPVFGRG